MQSTTAFSAMILVAVRGRATVVPNTRLLRRAPCVSPLFVVREVCVCVLAATTAAVSRAVLLPTYCIHKGHLPIVRNRLSKKVRLIFIREMINLQSISGK